jgi:transposase
VVPKYPLETCKGLCYIMIMGKFGITARELAEMFPDDAACLEHLFRVRYGNRHQCAKCGKDAKYHRVKKRRAYECEWCGYQVYPTAGTPFESTRTPLVDWFEVMHMFCTTRNGVSGKEIQRRIGCTYKTAWRMGHEIRKYMGYVDGDAPLGGPGGGAVEIDKSFIGGHDKKGEDDKAVVLGMIERGGEVITRVIPSKKGRHVQPEIMKHVKQGSRLMADEAPVYGPLTAHGYRLETVNHRAKEWVRGDAHVNNLEAFWANVKRMISGTHVWVSKKHLQKYLCEAEFRHNLRKHPYVMFDLLLSAFPKGARRAP